MPVVTLDEILESVRKGEDPRDVAASFGVTERFVRDRFERAGRIEEYRDVVRAGEAERVRSVDVEALMAEADKGRTLNQACVSIRCPCGIAARRLEDDGRMVEFHARSYAAREGRTVPSVSPERYHSGPRAKLVFLISRVSEDQADVIRSVISEMDEIVRGGAALSRMCGGGQ